MFAVEYNGHCVTWDAARKTILDTDPICPDVLPINVNTLEELGIKCVEKAYQIFPKEVKGKKPRRSKKKSN